MFPLPGEFTFNLIVLTVARKLWSINIISRQFREIHKWLETHPLVLTITHMLFMCGSSLCLYSAWDYVCSVGHLLDDKWLVNCHTSFISMCKNMYAPQAHTPKNLSVLILLLCLSLLSTIRETKINF